MGHMLEENDKMFSVKERPWHGLGTVIEDAPTVADAVTLSGLDWTAGIEKLVVMREISDGAGNVVQVPIPVLDQFAVVRQDKNIVLGVVGGRYEVYQNAEMWAFIEEFQNQSGIVLETAGSLRNGSTTWVLAKKGEIEAVAGDKLEEYFLFRNSFNGSTPISVLFTNIRVVCNNTLTMALRGAKNIYNVRHTASAGDQIKQVQKALGLQYKYQEKVRDIVAVLVAKPISATGTKTLLEDVIFPLNQKVVQTVDGSGQPVQSLAEATKQAVTARSNRINAVLELVENGAGADIPGVRGTLWGVYNAITEWADHSKQIRVVDGRESSEVRFESVMFGNASKFKEEALTSILAEAA